jgi:3-deoxy-D-manno-octulosonic-acid transferase
VGPHTDNFREVVADGTRAGILETVAGPAELAAAVSAALAEPARLVQRSAAARAAVETGRGAAARTAELVLPLLTTPHASRLSPSGSVGSR